MSSEPQGRERERTNLQQGNVDNGRLHLALQHSHIVHDAQQLDLVHGETVLQDSGAVLQAGDAQPMANDRGVDRGNLLCVQCHGADRGNERGVEQRNLVRVRDKQFLGCCHTGVEALQIFLENLASPQRHRHKHNGGQERQDAHGHCNVTAGAAAMTLERLKLIGAAFVHWKQGTRPRVGAAGSSSSYGSPHCHPVTPWTSMHGVALVEELNGANKRAPSALLTVVATRERDWGSVLLRVHRNGPRPSQRQGSHGLKRGADAVQQLARLLQSHSRVVAVVGRGVNDHDGDVQRLLVCKSFGKDDSPTAKEGLVFDQHLLVVLGRDQLLLGVACSFLLLFCYAVWTRQ